MCDRSAVLMSWIRRSQEVNVDSVVVRILEMGEWVWVGLRGS